MVWSVLCCFDCSGLVGLVCLPLLLVVLVPCLILFVFGLFAIAFGVLRLLFMVDEFCLGLVDLLVFVQVCEFGLVGGLVIFGVLVLV